MMRAHRHFMFTAVDQVAYSVGSLFAVFAVSRNFDSSTFGVFMLGYSVATLAVALARSYFGVDLSRTAAEESGAHELRFRQYATALLVISTPLAATFVLIAFVHHLLGGSEASVATLSMLGLALPFWLIHDVVRFYLARDRSGSVLIADVVRVLVLVVAFVTGATLPLWTFVGLWAGSFFAGSIVGLFATNTKILASSWREALPYTWTIRESITATASLGGIVPVVSGALVSGVFSAGALGAWRGASAAFGPLNTLIMYLDFGVLSRYVSMGKDARFRLGRVLALGLAAFAAAWGIVLLFAVPESFGLAMLGDSWSEARRYMPLVTAEYVFLLITAVLVLEFKYAQLASSLTVIKVVSSVVILVAVAVVCMTSSDPVYVAVANLAGAVAGTILTSAVLVQRRIRGSSS